jgi:undecaprenyl-diphosphatase
LLTITVTTALPHLLKAIVARERPDRVEIRGYRHGIPRSGKAFNAFPSGHAVHMGALASALARMAPNFRALIWSLGSFVALTRVVLLAHWMSDVVVGEALGITIENTLNALNRKPES